LVQVLVVVKDSYLLIFSLEKLQNEHLNPGLKPKWNFQKRIWVEIKSVGLDAKRINMSIIKYAQNRISGLDERKMM